MYGFFFNTNFESCYAQSKIFQALFRLSVGGFHFSVTQTRWDWLQIFSQCLYFLSIFVTKFKLWLLCINFLNLKITLKFLWRKQTVFEIAINFIGSFGYYILSKRYIYSFLMLLLIMTMHALEIQGQLSSSPDPLFFHMTSKLSIEIRGPLNWHFQKTFLLIVLSIWFDLSFAGLFFLILMFFWLHLRWNLFSLPLSRGTVRYFSCIFSETARFGGRVCCEPAS